MPQKVANLKGERRKKSKVALLLIDLINDLEFKGGSALAANILPLTENVSRLKRKAKGVGIPAIYVNDNFGMWQSDFRKLIDHCTKDPVRGRPLVTSLLPEPDDYFVLKPRHSGFYSTPLDLLLKYLGAKHLILAGITADLCILFTAGDAHMRDYKLMVPSDCVASEDQKFTEVALELLSSRLSVDITPSNKLNLKKLTSGNIESKEFGS